MLKKSFQGIDLILTLLGSLCSKHIVFEMAVDTEMGHVTFPCVLLLRSFLNPDRSLQHWTELLPVLAAFANARGAAYAIFAIIDT